MFSTELTRGYMTAEHSYGTLPYKLSAKSGLKAWRQRTHKFQVSSVFLAVEPSKIIFLI